jgi:hypothetical protein
MYFAAQIAKHFRELHFGGNWTSVNMQETLAGLTWQQAVTRVHGFNSIATLVHHTHYYVAAVKKVLEGGALVAKDSLSFNHPPINKQQDWEQMLERVWADAHAFAALIEQVPDERLESDFTDTKYGSYYRNLQGIVEHTHYHLGQMVLIKKMVQEQAGV